MVVRHSFCNFPESVLGFLNWTMPCRLRRPPVVHVLVPQTNQLSVSMNHYFKPAIAALVIACSACVAATPGDSFVEPPLKPGQVLDPDSQFAKSWPSKPSLVKLKDNLILAIPAQHHQFWTQRHWLTRIDTSFRPPYPLDKLPYAKSAGFTMHLPDFFGYTPDNYLKDFDENRVEIVYISPAPMSYMEPNAPGSYPPNQFARVSTGPYRAFDPEKYEEKYGLRCYQQLDRDSDSQSCYGKRGAEPDDYLFLDITPPPYRPSTRFPNMTTNYFSPKYGGLEIAWRTHMKNWPRWREIDTQVWKYIDAWNVAPKNR